MGSRLAIPMVGNIYLLLVLRQHGTHAVCTFQNVSTVKKIG